VDLGVTAVREFRTDTLLLVVARFLASPNRYGKTMALRAANFRKGAWTEPRPWCGGESNSRLPAYATAAVSSLKRAIDVVGSTCGRRFSRSNNLAPRSAETLSNSWPGRMIVLVSENRRCTSRRTLTGYIGGEHTPLQSAGDTSDSTPRPLSRSLAGHHSMNSACLTAEG